MTVQWVVILTYKYYRGLNFEDSNKIFNHLLIDIVHLILEW